MFIDLTFTTRAKAALAGSAALALFAIAGSASAATLVQYDFTGNVGNEAVEPASFTADNIDAVDFSRGSGLNPTTNGGAFSANNFGVYASNPDDYFTFGLSTAAGYTATVEQLVFSARSSNTGPRDLAVLASVDGADFQQIATFTQTNANVASRVLDFTPLTGVSSLVFRIVTTSNVAANGGTLANTGTFRVQNYTGAPASPFSINGDVSLAATPAVPEPATWAMMITGFGLVGGAMRRRSARIAYSV